MGALFLMSELPLKVHPRAPASTPGDRANNTECLWKGVRGGMGHRCRKSNRGTNTIRSRRPESGGGGVGLTRCS